MAVAAARRRADRDEDRFGALRWRRARSVVKVSRPAATLRATSWSRPGSKIGMTPLFERLDLRCVLVDADHVMAEVREAGAGNQADIAGADDRDPHARVLGYGRIAAALPKPASGTGFWAAALDRRGQKKGAGPKAGPKSRGVPPPKRQSPSYQPEPGPKVISTRRFCGSRTPSAVSTSGRLSPNASVVIEPSGTPRPAR